MFQFESECEELHQQRDRLRAEAGASMAAASQSREDRSTHVEQVSAAARCEALAQRVDERIAEEC